MVEESIGIRILKVCLIKKYMSVIFKKMLNLNESYIFRFNKVLNSRNRYIGPKSFSGTVTTKTANARSGIR
jgi:hypothetical protein